MYPNALCGPRSVLVDASPNTTSTKEFNWSDGETEVSSRDQADQQ